MGNKTDMTYIPQPTSSIMIEFYNTTDIVTKFDRSNYNVKIYLDDKPVYIENVCKDQICKWDLVADYLLSRTFKNDQQGHTTL